jgi:hypothetical protein
MNSNNQWNESYTNPSQGDSQNWDVDKLVAQGDAIYDYERVPADWMGFDEQPMVYQYGDSATWQNGSNDEVEKRAS